MKAAVIGASGEALHTIKKAHEYGLTIVALDGNPRAAGLKAADKPIVTDISDEKAVLRELRRERPNFVLTVPIGRYLTTIGTINDALGLPGISREMADLCTDKFRFHKRLHENNMRRCRCYQVEEGRIRDTEGTVFPADDTGADGIPLALPAILKPGFGSGSRGIHIITQREQLVQALKTVSGEPYVLEECIAGEEYGVDGAVVRGEFQMILLRKKENTPLPFRQAVGYFSVLPSDGFWQQVYDYMKKAVKCLGIGECLLHADIIKGTEGPFIIELSARPSGHNLHNLFTPLCTGVDMAEEYMKYRMGHSYSFRPETTKSMMIHYFDMEGIVRNVPGREQASQALQAELAAWECNIRQGEKLEPVSDGHSLMGRGYFVLEGSGFSHLCNQAQIVKNMFF
ncbi:MAG: ATP-grasp domain-containing protein [Lachnospiraceae bacterium]|nr:ATP-grasp domain-containing protein [Lachnospiraceae bacterium]